MANPTVSPHGDYIHMKFTKVLTARINAADHGQCHRSCAHLVDVFEERSGNDYRYCKQFDAAVGYIGKPPKRCDECRKLLKLKRTESEPSDG